jgi:hypothetical protein
MYSFSVKIPATALQLDANRVYAGQPVTITGFEKRRIHCISTGFFILLACIRQIPCPCDPHPPPTAAPA